MLDDTEVVLDPHREWITYTPFITPGQRSVFEPDRNVIETLDGEVIEERLNPRAAFASHTAETLWDELNVAYFSGYAMRNYLTTPFLFTLPGFELDEIEPWEEDGETWRRLHVVFPASIATHNAEQTFYFDSDDGLLRRQDYNADVFGGTPTANYARSHRTFDGLVFPTERRVVPGDPSNRSLPGPVLVSIEVIDVWVR